MVAKPRIYTYKITFEEVPYWYWGVHKEKKYGELYFGSPVAHKWAWEFYTPKVQILEYFDSWEEAKNLENRLIRPDLNNKYCLNEAIGFHMSLASCRKGGRSAVNLAKSHGFGFYGPKTEKQILSSKKHSSILASYSSENGAKTGRENVELQRGIWGLPREQQLKNSSNAGKIGGKITGAQLWIDPDHLELGEKPACVLVKMQKSRGYPYGPSNRVRIG